MTQKLTLRLTVLEKIVTKPDLGQVSLVLIGSVYFFNSVKCLSFEVKALPYL